MGPGLRNPRGSKFRLTPYQLTRGFCLFSGLLELLPGVFGGVGGGVGGGVVLSSFPNIRIGRLYPKP